MEQLWSYMYMSAKDRSVYLRDDQLSIKTLPALLSALHQYKIDWTDASLWPEDYIQGQWTRVVPMSYLSSNMGRGLSMMVVKAVCSGEWYCRPVASAAQGQHQDHCGIAALAGLLNHCVKEVQRLLSIWARLQSCCRAWAAQHVSDPSAMGKKQTEAVPDDPLLLRRLWQLRQRMACLHV